MGNVVVQALILGLPVLGSDIGGIPEMIDHDKNGLLIPPSDSEAWQQASDPFWTIQPALKHGERTPKPNSERFHRDANGRKVLTFHEDVVAMSKSGGNQTAQQA